jgi:hypothetical protein
MNMTESDLEYIRNTYDVPAKISQRVKYEGRGGVICGTKNGRLKIHFDDSPKPDKGVYHPTWEMVYE